MTVDKRSRSLTLPTSWAESSPSGSGGTTGYRSCCDAQVHGAAWGFLVGVHGALTLENSHEGGRKTGRHTTRRTPSKPDGFVSTDWCIARVPRSLRDLGGEGEIVASTS